MVPSPILRGSEGFNAYTCHLLGFTSKSIFGVVEHVMVLTHHSTQRWQQASVNIGACATHAVCMARCVSWLGHSCSKSK